MTQQVVVVVQERPRTEMLAAAGVLAFFLPPLGCVTVPCLFIGVLMMVRIAVAGALAALVLSPSLICFAAAWWGLRWGRAHEREQIRKAAPYAAGALAALGVLWAVLVLTGIIEASAK